MSTLKLDKITGLTGNAGDSAPITLSGDTATFRGTHLDDINMSSGKSIKKADGTALLTEAGVLDNVSLGTSVTGNSTLPSMGAMVKLATATASGSNYIAFDNTVITSAYTNYRLIGTGITASDSSVNMRLKFSYDNGTSWSNLIAGRMILRLDAAGDNSYDAGATDQIVCSYHDANNTATQGYYLNVDYYGLQTQDKDKHCQWQTSGYYGTGYAMDGTGLIFRGTSTRVIDYIWLAWSAGTIVTGDFSLYGMA